MGKGIIMNCEKYFCTVVLIFVLSLFSMTCTADEINVLKSFDELRINTVADLETAGDSELMKYKDTLANALDEIEALYEKEEADKRFIDKSKECFKLYQTAGREWEHRNREYRGGSFLSAKQAENRVQQKWREASMCIKSLRSLYNTRMHTRPSADKSN